MDLFQWLEAWYQSMCNGSWEHCYGITIDTLDNPGWIVRIDIEDTDLENKEFNEIWYDNGDKDWLICRISQGKFEGSGDVTKLKKILNIFKEWDETKE